MHRVERAPMVGCAGVGWPAWGHEARWQRVVAVPCIDPGGGRRGWILMFRRKNQEAPATSPGSGESRRGLPPGGQGH